jgi:hypothetical protein
LIIIVSSLNIAMKVKSKFIFFEMWEAGVLGNRTQLWRNPDDAYQWGYETALAHGFRDLRYPKIGFREIRTGAGQGKWQKVSWPLVPYTAETWRKEGRKFILDDGAPDQFRTLQGELCRTYRGLEGYLDTVGKLPMRPAMAAGHMRHCTGAMVNALLDRFMDASSRDDLRDLLDLYPDATIEFSSFSRDVGILPGRNTLFWETRDY